MTATTDTLFNQLSDILESARQHVSNMKPSEWVERHRVMPTENTAYPGPFRYSRTPYLREIIDCLSSDHPAHTVIVMKGAQLGFSAGVIEGGIGWIIAQSPGPTLFLSGHEDLSEEMMNTRVDSMIDNSGLRAKIKPNALRKRNARSGDTSKSKEFPGGFLIAGSANNHKLLRQRSIRYGFLDDYDAVKKSSKESGDTDSLIEKRFASYALSKKVFKISTPELKASSNIEPAYLQGDQRKFFVPCPCCSEEITLEWETELKDSEKKNRAGITWQLDENGKLMDGSVGYICQKCGGFFNDSKKLSMLQAGRWRATGETSEVGYYSYHISALYAPPGMDDWDHYVREYLRACPPGGKVDEKKLQTFQNTVLGMTYEQKGDSPKASELQRNIRPYDIGIVPEELSMADGNGRIIMLTCAADMNGTEQDARLDFEVVAWAESGAQYSIRHGSIGTFVLAESRKKVKEDRERWSYNFKAARNVWADFSKVRAENFKSDKTGRSFPILFTGLDCGHLPHYAYAYIDNAVPVIVGLKGREETKFSKYNVDFALYRPSKERSNLYMVEVNRVKDDVSVRMNLPWNKEISEKQPPGFMNFPTPGGGLYLFDNYFSHFEAEHKVQEIKDGQELGFRWVKRNSAVQNHYWDCKVYNLVLKDIVTDIILKEEGIKDGTWHDLVNLFSGKK